MLACESRIHDAPAQPERAECVREGATTECACDGAAGVATCTGNTYGPCVCSPIVEPETDAGVEAEACTPLAWYPDVDKDGFGDALAMPAMACEQPPGMVADHTDCADADERAHPGQTVMQESPVKVVGGGDFNCDGVASPKLMEFTTKCEGSCSFAAGPGWLNLAPECGETGTWLLDCGFDASGCTMQTVTRGAICL